MHIGLIGMGDIAKKAYLPVITAESGIELFVSTRNPQVLKEIGQQYRVPQDRLFSNVEALLSQKLDAAFVHAATEAHAEIVECLLENGVHVYVDKPVTYSAADSERLLKLAAAHNRVLMTGFNRRYAPLYQSVQQAVVPQLIVMQKNRASAAEPARTAILDDFIHVVDTMLYMMPETPTAVDCTFRTDRHLLTQVTVQLASANCTAIGAMHREAGCDEEVLEVVGDGQKWRVTNLRDAVAMHEGEAHSRPGNWTSVGRVRGFTGITTAFLEAVRQPDPELIRFDAFKVLKTHQVCEELVARIERQISEK